MSNFLAEALGDDSPKFGHIIMAAERRAQHPNHDLRLSSKILSRVRAKVVELGLDPDDTTAEELYYRLGDKLAEQEMQLTKKLRILAAKNVNAEANLTDGLKVLVKSLNITDCLSLKNSALKRQLKAQPPKKVMKILKYRSLESMLKLEPMALVLLAINNYESDSYIHNFYAKYKNYHPSDFEVHKLNFITPTTQKWQKLLSDIRGQSGLTLVSSYETASIILLPLNNEPQTGLLSLVVAKLINELTNLLTVSSYLKLHQVSADFGSKLKSIAESGAYLELQVLGHPLSWRSALYALEGTGNEAFIPHMTPSDLKPVNLFNKFYEVLDDIKFWQDTDALAMVKSAEATSLNLLDVATNLVNKLPFEKRQLGHFRQSLRQELAKLYVDPDQILDPYTSDAEQPTETQDKSIVVG